MAGKISFKILLFWGGEGEREFRGKGERKGKKEK